MKKITSPRIEQRAADWYPTVFPNLHNGLVYILEVFPQMYRWTLREMQGTFEHEELLGIISATVNMELSPSMAGEHIIPAVKNFFGSTPAHDLIAKFQTLTTCERVCLEIWACGYWIALERDPGLDPEDWITPLLG